jgi:hypothetical protein
MLATLMTMGTFAAGMMLAAAGDASPGLDYTVYGVASTTVAILLYIIKTLWADNRLMRADLNELTTKALDRVTTVATQATLQLSQSEQSMEAAMAMMHQLSGRPTLTGEQIAEVIVLLRELRLLREAEDRERRRSS